MADPNYCVKLFTYAKGLTPETSGYVWVHGFKDSLGAELCFFRTVDRLKKYKAPEFIQRIELRMVGRQVEWFDPKTQKLHHGEPEQEAGK